ncbi:hypothetical protein [Helicobacter sp. T3_23-1059]
MTFCNALLSLCHQLDKESKIQISKIKCDTKKLHTNHAICPLAAESSPLDSSFDLICV